MDLLRLLHNSPTLHPHHPNMKPSIAWMSHSRLTQYPILLLAASTLYSFIEALEELPRGFEASPDPSVSLYQPLLNDSSGNFSLSFIRVNSTQLDLAIVHVPSREALWQAGAARSVTWSDKTKLIFNGSLVISDDRSGVVWSSGTSGDQVVLLNTSNLQIQKLDKLTSVQWQSFDFPQNTLVENQNFTTNMTLVSSNGLYTLRLGNTFMGLYAKLGMQKNQIYWKHKALEAKAEIVVGSGPILARINPDGYLGMYQTGNVPVDVQVFTMFQRRIGGGLLIVRLEPDGNLKGYYWDGSNWVLDYQAITDTCELPDPCGSYGLCTPGSGCSCLDNRTTFSPGGCGFSYTNNHDLCSGGAFNGVKVLRRSGVELPFKELMRFETASSSEQCESSCQQNCSCYGALYNNASGFCYVVDYPIRTVLGTRAEGKVGYFKVWEGTTKKKVNAGLAVLIGLLCAAILCLILAVGSGVYKMWKRKRGVKRILEPETGSRPDPGPYKDLGSASFRFIEMSSR